MLVADLSKEHCVKSHHRTALMDRIDRNNGSIEFKHQNISIFPLFWMNWASRGFQAISLEATTKRALSPARLTVISRNIRSFLSLFRLLQRYCRHLPKFLSPRQSEQRAMSRCPSALSVSSENSIQWNETIATVHLVRRGKNMLLILSVASSRVLVVQIWPERFDGLPAWMETGPDMTFCLST